MSEKPQNSRLRIAGIDIVRGIAIYLMIQSHTVKGLLYFRDMPSWGINPMHTLTKLSSPLFIFVFGLTLGVTMLPKAGDARFPALRNHLWFRALLVLFWYKVLTVVQYFQTAPKQDIIDMLLYKKFPDFAEVLDFYSWMLLIIPFIMWAIRRSPIWVTPLAAALIYWLGIYLRENCGFFGVVPLKAILVEHDGTFVFGLMSRGPYVLMGLFFGDLISRSPEVSVRRQQVAVMLIALGVMFMGLFLIQNQGQLDPILTAMARNAGKHPPQAFFTQFSLGGALTITGLCLFITRCPWILKPLEILGRESLTCFATHLIVVFVGLRWALGLKVMKGPPQVTYPQALGLTFAVVGVCIVVSLLNHARKEYKNKKKAEVAAFAKMMQEKEQQALQELIRCSQN